MLSAVDPLRLTPELAYRVPWEVDRTRAPWYRVENCGAEPLHGVRVAMLDDGSLLSASMTAVAVGGHFTFVVRDDHPALSSIAVVRWFRPNESEYLWRVSF